MQKIYVSLEIKKASEEAYKEKLVKEDESPFF